VLGNATLRELRDRLRAEEYHIVHFMGHGGFSEDTGEGTLIMEDEKGAALPVRGQGLAALLSDSGSVRLVVISACDTATATPEDQTNPFTGVATALIGGGVTVVVAMQFPITDLAAATFSRSLYESLAAGVPVEEAVTEGRIRLYLEKSSDSDWLSPVLFCRGSFSEIFAQRDAGEITDIISSKLRSIFSRRTIAKRDVMLSSRPLEGAAREFEGVKDYTTALLRQVETSYSEARRDARIWSVASLVAAGLGLGMVIAALVGLFLSQRELGVISGVSGVVSGAVSALFFRQWRSASSRLAIMVDDLGDLRKLDFAQYIAQTMETPTERDKAKAAVVQALLTSSKRGKRGAFERKNA